MKGLASPKSSVISILLGILILAGGGVVYSGDDIFCAIYTKTAIVQNQANLSSGCNFTGPRWSSDADSHSKWCINVSMAAADSETKARSDELKKCTGSAWPAGSHRRCNIYALLAMAQHDGNVKALCGYTGPRWSSDYNAHYNWCVNVSKVAADGEWKARHDGLVACAP